MKRFVLLMVILLAPAAGALVPQGADVCEQTAPVGIVGFCYRLMIADAAVTLTYTQKTLSCDTNECLYQPSMLIGLDQFAPGKWVLRATSEMTHYPSGSLISGSKRSLACNLEGPDASCTETTANKQIVGDHFSSARWRGEWRVYVIEADGTENLQARGTGSGWLAQYHPDA